MTTKIAYLSVPYVGGTYTRFVSLRPRLTEFGFDFRCIHCDLKGSDPLRVEPVAEGIERWLLPADLPTAARMAIDRLTAESYALVLALPLGKIIHMGLMPYLPNETASILVVPSMTRTSYEYAEYLSRYCDGVIAVSDRVKSDLVGRFRVEDRDVTVVFNGVDIERFTPGEDSDRSSNVLRVLYCGRLEDSSKGVLWLPDIIAETIRQKGDCRLDVLGSGGDRDRLIAKVQRRGLQDRIRVLDPVPHEACAALMRSYDCLCMPSRIEACGYSLLEAMASGCVPVASDIRGSVGTIVEDGVSGFLAPPGDVSTFAQRLALLHGDRARLAVMRRAAVERVRSKYTVDGMAEAYAAVFRAALARTTHRTRIPIESFAVPRIFKRRWRSRLPKPVKKFVRKWMTQRGGVA
jgi:glycosyltransferase involved in cell wall biosynthesis